MRTQKRRKKGLSAMPEAQREAPLCADFSHRPVSAQALRGCVLTLVPAGKGPSVSRRHPDSGPRTRWRSRREERRGTG